GCKKADSVLWQMLASFAESPDNVIELSNDKKINSSTSSNIHLLNNRLSSLFVSIKGRAITKEKLGHKEVYKIYFKEIKLFNSRDKDTLSNNNKEYLLDKPNDIETFEATGDNHASLDDITEDDIRYRF
ncbi:MAG: hypothetical protein ACUZ8H_03670, partial [Candidatus Anammoxibacter sp.]